jgi:hypothetical protein
MKTYTGLNIQYPISQSILDGSKTIETRTYPLPERLKDVEILMVETPGKTGKFKSRIVAKITFSSSFKYKSKKEFHEDFKKHKVDPKSEWDWKEKSKWGWIIKNVEILIPPRPLKKRLGIIYTNGLQI